ncbi:MFS transporter [Caenimonas sedimenti]|uniref:MFS transporter n=1 Tax=Caenimonas sedimenti TaxID=2596921 RepID=A0A562ZSB9_9BURK|nr:MFS transporter [Caenimonas sedimenti]TWO71261.1 MFS transporter [Caenimonas sedimenti]
MGSAGIASSSDWPRVGLLLLCGMFAATQVGKLPPSMTELREQYGASLVQLGWITSVFNLTAATVGLAAGLLADRIGRRNILKLGLLALGAGALIGALSPGIGVLFASRIVEGLGFVCIVVSAPALMRDAATASRLKLALGLWSSYMALGMTTMLLLAPLLMGALGWRGGWWVGVLGAAALLTLTLWAFPEDDRAAAAVQAPAALLAGLQSSTPWLLAGCFAIYTLQWMTMMVWLPTFLQDEFGFGLARATGFVAVVIIVNAPGAWLGGWLSNRGVSPALLMLVSTLVMGFAGWGAFAAGADPLPRLALCIAFSFVGGVLPAAIYACLPAVAAPRQNFGSVNGLAVQASNLGALLGPPSAAALVGLGGWHGMGWAYLATAAASAMLILRAAKAPELQAPGSTRAVHG